jgi:S1-C subfamily serine protease
MKYEEAIQIVNEDAVSLLQGDAGLSAIGVGAKGGGPLSAASDFAVVASVPQKLSESELRKQKIASVPTAFAATLGKSEARRTQIEIVESGGYFQPLPGLSVPAHHRGLFGRLQPVTDLQKPFVALRPGVSICNPTGSYPQDLCAGTLGFFIRDKDEALYLVSNNHVLALVNRATVGDDILQPGTLDLTSVECDLMGTTAALSRQLKVAELSGWVDIEFPTRSKTPNNFVDVAWAKVTAGAGKGSGSGRTLDAITRVGFAGSIRAIASAFEADQKGRLVGATTLFKVGRATGLTEGQITQLNVATPVTYDGQVAYFTGQIQVDATLDCVGPFSGPGDSGAIVVNPLQEAVGMVFAGTAFRTLVNPIADLMRELGAKLPGAKLCTA